MGGPSGAAGRVGPSNCASAAIASTGSSGSTVRVSSGSRAKYDQRPRAPSPSEIRQSENGSSAKVEATSAGSRQWARRIVGGLSMQTRILLPHPGTDGVDGIAAQHAAARQEPPVLPVGKPELGSVERILSVHPAGHAVADEACLDLGVEARLRGGIIRNQRGGKARTEPVEERDRFGKVVHDLQRHLRGLLPLPFAAERIGGQRLDDRLVVVAV